MNASRIVTPNPRARDDQDEHRGEDREGHDDAYVARHA
jgi:hypothetical protein